MAKNRGASPPPAPKGNNRGSNNSGGEGKKGNKNAVGNEGGDGAPEGNTRAMTHGVRADPANVESELTDKETEFVADFKSKYLEFAPFDGDDARAERLHILGIKAAQEWRGERIIAKDGPSVKSIAFVDDDGTEHTEMKEHHLARFTSRLSKDVRMGLKDLGCLPDPDSQQADATRSLAEMLSEAGEQDEDEPIDVESSAVDSEDEDDE